MTGAENPEEKARRDAIAKASRDAAEEVAADVRAAATAAQKAAEAGLSTIERAPGIYDADWQSGGLARFALDHATSWFAIHANQRLQAVNFFLIATGFLASAYVAALDSNLPQVAVVIGIFGAITALLFLMLEIRTRRLVDIGESAIKPLQALLAQRLGENKLKILEETEPNKPRRYFWEIPFQLKVAWFRPFRIRYGTAIPAIELLTCIAFGLGAGFSGVRYVNTKGQHDVSCVTLTRAGLRITHRRLADQELCPRA